MVDAVLFLGIPLSDEMRKLLEQINPHAVKLFLDNKSEYLHQTSHDGTRYVGKYLERASSLESLELVEANILSLLQKLIPELPPIRDPLILFATQRETDGVS